MSGFQELEILGMDDLGNLFRKNLSGGLADHLLTRQAVMPLAGSVDQEVAEARQLLDDDAGRHIVDDRVEEGTGAADLVFGAIPFGEVDNGADAGRPALVGQRADENGDVDHAAVRFDVAPCFLGAIVSLSSDLEHGLAILGRPDVEDGHAQELFAAVAVMRDGGVVDGEEPPAGLLEDPHRHRVAFEQQAERGLALL